MFVLRSRLLKALAQEHAGIGELAANAAGHPGVIGELDDGLRQQSCSFAGRAENSDRCFSVAGVDEQGATSLRPANGREPCRDLGLDVRRQWLAGEIAQHPEQSFGIVAGGGRPLNRGLGQLKEGADRLTLQLRPCRAGDRRNRATS